MVHRASSWLGMMAGVFLLSLVPGICRAQQAKLTIEQILQVWTARQEKVARARFNLDCEETKHKGAISFMDREPRRIARMPAETEPNPPRDYLVKGTSSVSLDGAKLRYAYDHQQWDPVGKKLYPEHYVDVFDGHLHKLLMDPASGQEEYPYGGVRKRRASESALQFAILPLIFTFRGNHPQFFRDLVKFQISGQAPTVAGRPCLELVRDDGTADGREFLYVDRKRDYVVVKEMTVLDGQPNWQLDVSYEADDVVGWVPKSWEYVIRVGKDRCIINSGRSAVTSYEINAAIDGSEFDILFPPNTRVTDETSEQEVQYVIRENGEKGTEIPRRLNPTYEDLQKAGARRNPWLWKTASALILAVALGAWISLRLRRKKTG
jgi:hypothetical protein